MQRVYQEWRKIGYQPAGPGRKNADSTRSMESCEGGVDLPKRVGYELRRIPFSGARVAKRTLRRAESAMGFQAKNGAVGRETEPVAATLPFSNVGPSDLELSGRTATEHISQIFAVSAGLTGVSLSGIGLFSILSHLRSVETFGERFLAADSSIFMVSCVAAFLALKTHVNFRRRIYRWIAEGTFLTGLVLMACICIFIAFLLH